MQELYFPLDAILDTGTQRVFDGKIKTISRRSIKSQTALSGCTSIGRRLTKIK